MTRRVKYHNTMIKVMLFKNSGRAVQLSQSGVASAISIFIFTQMKKKKIIIYYFYSSWNMLFVPRWSKS